MMHCYSLLLGARQTSATSGRFKPSDDRRLREITRKHFPKGFTILSARGGWFSPDQGRFISEESRQILVTAEERRALKPWCQELARAFAQEELMVVHIGRAVTYRFRASAKSTTRPHRPKSGQR